ncbi:MAG: VTT domain-containing protein [Gammaproteobacteria bacterium]
MTEQESRAPFEALTQAREAPLFGRSWRRCLAGALVLSAVALMLAIGERLDLHYVQAQHSQLLSIRTAHPLATAVAYFAVFFALTALSLPVAGVLTLLGGSLFGITTALPLAAVASSCGATAAFMLSRYLFRNWVCIRFPARVAMVEAGVAVEGAFYLFALRMMPAVPFFVLNAAMGLTGMPAGRFFLVTLIGMLPVLSLLALAGERLAAIRSMHDVLNPGLVIALTALGMLPLLARRFIGYLRRMRHRPGTDGADKKKPA